MRQKKNIDQLFNERFANHQADPPSHVWDKVQARLEKDKKDRVIAIWWRTAGVAASLALIISLAGLLDATQSNVVVEQQQNIEQSPAANPKIDKALEINLRQDKPRVATSNNAAQNNAIKPQVKSSDNTVSKNKPNVLKTPENAVVKLVAKKDAGVLSKNFPVISENKEIIKKKFDYIIISPGIDINKCRLSKFLKNK